MKRFKPGDICIIESGYYKGLHVEVISYLSATRVHIRNIRATPSYTFFCPEELLVLESIYNSPLYQALS